MANQLNQTATDKVISYLDKVSGKIGEFVGKLADQLGVASKHVYEVLVQQQVVEGITDIIVTFVLLLAIIAFWIIMPKYVYPHIFWVEDDVPSWLVGVGTVVAGVLTIAFAVNMLPGLAEDLRKIMNPEYYAMRTVVDYIQQMAHGQSGESN